ncbi:NRPS protein [Diaporthe australafricana]|uniref:NRPS protein n=1 Tax=Diaporthe australafricana TaxID=127596 RepID=A0ABR3W083_9PEZI
MLDDLIRALQQGENDGAKQIQWTHPSVLNYPPTSRPVGPPRQSHQGPSEGADEPALLHRWFESRVDEEPQRAALDFLVDVESRERRQFTYQQLENASNALARDLVRSRGARVDSVVNTIDTVAVMIGPCPELYMSYLAALKAGMAFCPIPVDVPQDRFDALLADLEPSALLVAGSSSSTSSKSHTSTAATTIDVRSYLAACDEEVERLGRHFTSTVIEHNVAYVLYTSGTTGKPKGVAVSHLSACCTISALSSHYGFTVPTMGKSDPLSVPVRWFQGAAPTFDISLFEIFWTLSSGSTLCCAPRHLTLHDINKVITTLGADITNITPSFATLLEPTSVRGLMLGGETLNARVLHDFAQYNPSPESNSVSGPSGLYNGYGPTETAIYCIAQAHVPEGQRGSVIGSPLETCGIIIVDENLPRSSLIPVPMGATGELVIAGPQVSRVGYLNRPDETSQAFIGDEETCWGRVYRTGDRARLVWDVSGKPVVEFLGRISDDQVKLSGRRVELGEIESVLMARVEGVQETVSCVWKPENSGPGSEKVVNLVTVKPGRDSEETVTLCTAAAQRYLPDYMRPFKFLHVESLPKTASGKTDRKASSAYIRDTLKTWKFTQKTSESSDIVRPLAGEDAQIEEKLLSLVSTILGGAPVTATTPLAEAGLDSLRAMRLLREIRRSFQDNADAPKHLQPSLAILLGSQATVRSVFFSSSSAGVTPTGPPGGLEAVSRSQIEDFSRNLPEAVDRLNLSSETDVEVVLPATPTQSQLAVSFAMDRSRYISHTVLELGTGVSAAALTRAVEAVVSEQAVYRCIMMPTDDPLSPFAQVILTPEAWRRLNSNNGSTHAHVVHRKASSALSVDDAQKWVDMAQENIGLDLQSLYHIQVIEDETSATGSGGMLVISIAHCICDGASVEVLLCDIARRYAGLESLHRQGIYDAVLECFSNVSPETDALWRDSLKGFENEPFGVLSGDNIQANKDKSSPNSSADYGMVQYKSDLPWQDLEDKSRTLGAGASPLAVLQASWSLLLSIFSEGDTGDVSFGSVVSGHLSTTTHAPTFSVVPCRVALPETDTIGHLVQSLSALGKLALGHRHTSWGAFESLPYNTALALQAYPVEDVGPQTPWTQVRRPAIRYDFPIFVEVYPNDPDSPDRNQFTNLTFKITYRQDVLSELSAGRIAKQFAALTDAVLASSPDDFISLLPSRLPRTLLSAEGSVPEVSACKQGEEDRQLQLLHGQFESKAISDPSRLALTFHVTLDSVPTSLTYAELDARANGLAHLLREEDVEIIPICLDRSVDLYVSVLAILKAGSAWCPIDTTSPIARRTSLIARTKSKVLLTTTDSQHLVEPCIASGSLGDMRVILVDQHSAPTPVRPRPRQGIQGEDISGQDLAYLLWTSGTTGEPKGVMIQHSAAAQAMRDLQVQVEHDPECEQVRTLQLSANSFDVFVQDLFYTWGLGGSVISGTRELVLGSFVDFIWKARPTHAHLTPSFGASIPVEEIRGSTLQYVTFIGEKLTEDVAEAWAAPGITTRAYNTYGPAENAVVSTMRRFFGKSRDRAKAANVGFPLNPCTAYVVREVPVPGSDKKRWELVPRYGVGELALGGAQVAKGYLGNAAKTASQFLQGGPGIDERIYLTGDMVRLNDHGFEFLGRNDDLVKITGIRIELSEISAACASIKDEEGAIEHVETLHLPRPDRENADNKIVVTFVSVNEKNGADTGAIKSKVFKRARDMLPAYMVPGHVVVLDTTMPRTASNKVDRKALQDIYKKSDLQSLTEGGDSAGYSIGHASEKKQWTEQQLPVLHFIADKFNVAVEPLSPGDSLAGLGLSSLQVTKLAWSLRRQLSAQVGVLDLMKCQLLGELVEVVVHSKQGQKGEQARPKKSTIPETEPKRATNTSTTAEGSRLASTKDVLTNSLRGDMLPSSDYHLLPATPMQESLIVETMREPRAYWAHRVFDLSHLDSIPSERLRAAWTLAAGTLDILRTSFVPLAQLDVTGEENGASSASSVQWVRSQGVQATILQVVHQEPVLRWTVLSDGEDQDLSRWARETSQVEISPKSVPWAITVAERERKMMLSMHHSLYDYDTSETILRVVTDIFQQSSAVCQTDVVQFERGMELGLLPTSEQRAEAASFWAERLAGLRKTSGVLNAPFPDLTQSRQKQEEGILSAKRPISEVFSAPGVPTSLPTLFQSAFGCVMASYLELKAVILGQNVSQRLLHPDLANVVGPAIATLPLAVRADAPSAEELWAEMARDSSNLFRVTHNLHPVDSKRLLNEGVGSSSAPFAGVFVFHPASSGDVEVEAQNLLFREIEQAVSLNVEHPLAFNIFEGDGIMELTGDGRSISQAQLSLMLDHIIDQARVMIEFPRYPLTHLQNRLDRGLISLSGAIEEDAKEEDLNFDPTDSVAQHASQHPEWIAAEEVDYTDDAEDNEELTISTKTITFAMLDRLTNAIASQLSSHNAGLQKDDVVALCLGRDIKSLAATLAIFRAGYVYLPVDESLPRARKQLLIRDAAAKVVITTDELATELDLDPNDPPSLLLPDGEGDVELILQSQKAPYQSRSSEDPSRGHGGYLIYTSGSTGRPKGVRVSNRNLCHFISSFSQRMSGEASETSSVGESLGGSGKYLNLTSRAFDPHLTQLFVPWHLGYRVVIGDRTALLGNLQHAINQIGVTHFGSVPSVLTQLRLCPEDIPSVRVVTTGGEKASNELLDMWTRPDRSWQSRSGGDGQGVRLVNFYGPTEVTIGCLGHAVGPNSNARNLGLPLKGLEALLLSPTANGDEQLITRRGQPGELCIAGPQVAMGYLDRPAENAKSFQTISIFGGPERRIYRTGDIMRMMHDGSLEFLGRADQQAKIRGQRLELDEVVSFLKEQSSDEGDLEFAAAVVGSQENPQQQRLFGFVARKSCLKGESDTEAELLQNQGQELTSLLERLEGHCENKLPAFMVPKLLWVSKIPYLAASGKVDTKVLARLANDFSASQAYQEDQDSDDSGVDVASSTLDPEQLLVIAAVEEVLGHKMKKIVTSSSSVTQLGVDSLSAVHLGIILRKRGFSKLSISHLLASTATVGSVAQLADKKAPLSHSETTGKATSRDDTSETSKIDEVEELSLSTVLAGRVVGNLDSDNVEAVLPCLPLQAALVARSMIWLSANDDHPSQSNSEGAAATIPYVSQFNYQLSQGTDLTRWRDAAERVVASEAMLRTCFVQREDDGQVFQVVLRSPRLSTFDSVSEDPADIVANMSSRPPIRIQLRQEEDSRTLVSLRIHHALFDGVAISVLLRRLEQAYNGVMERDFSAAANKSLDVLTRLSAHCKLSKAQVDSASSLWQEKLRGVLPCHIGPTDSSKDTIRSVRCLPWTLNGLRDMLGSQKSVVSASSAFQVATALCLSQITGQTKSVAYGFVMSLRPLLDHVSGGGLDEFLGPCLNTLIHAVELNKEESLVDCASRVQKMHADACQGAMPLVSVEKVQRWAGSEDKLFDSLLSINVLPSMDESRELQPGRMSALDTGSKSDMALAFDVDLHQDGRIVLTLSSAGVLSESELDQAGQLFEKAVDMCNAVDKNVRVGDLLSPAGTAFASRNAHHKLNDIGVGVQNFDTNEDDAEFENTLASVQAVLCHLLSLEPSDIKKDKTTFYQLGLDSITVLSFVRLLNKSEKVKLTPDAILKARTVHGLAKLLQQVKKKTNTSPRRQEQTPAEESQNDGATYDKTLARLAKDFLFVATPLQEGMLSATLATSSKAYTYVHTIQLSELALHKDTPSLDYFFAAVTDTVQACEILRTKFIFTQDEEAPWVGLVSPREQSDLVSWTLLGRDKVQLQIHHALYDASSIQAVWRILGDYYRQRLRANDQLIADSGAASQAHQYRPFAKAVATMQKSAVTFWANLLRDYRYSPVEFPDDLAASSAFHFSMTKEELSKLQIRCRGASVTIKTLLMLAWAKVLSERICGQPDVVYGQVISSGHEADTVIGPTINTVPMRTHLNKGSSVAEGLSQVQKLSDDALGGNAMASLRKTQELWRSSSSFKDETVPASLFQSLFVFDGVIADIPDQKEGTDSIPLFAQVHAENGTDDNGPAFDDYPLIVSFHIKDNILSGKLRAKMTRDEVRALGGHLETAVRSLTLDDLQQPALDMDRVDATKKARSVITQVTPALGAPDSHDTASKIDAVLDVVKTVLGSKYKGKSIDGKKPLVNVGIDSISAIRLSTLLKRRLRMTVSVLQILKGASIHDIIITNSTPPQPADIVTQHEKAKKVDLSSVSKAAKELGLQEKDVKSVLPLLPGQRTHLEHWLHNGKRFFEAPWVYRVDDQVDETTVKHAWVQLCQLHDILRTTFLRGDEPNAALFQVTMSEQWSPLRSFTGLQDSTSPIQTLIEKHVREGNSKPSDLREPPVHLTLLQGADGKAIVLRLHHALYDAWSIKLILNDLDQLMALGKPQSRPSLADAFEQIMSIRQLAAEDLYWRDHLVHAQETLLGHLDSASPASTQILKSPLGPHFQVRRADVIEQSTFTKFSEPRGRSDVSAAIILAYARTLQQLTQCSRPTFGVNHAARSLCSPDETQTLDLTGMNMPTMTTTPFCLELDTSTSSSSSISDEDLMHFIQDHLAQLTKFAQSDGVRKFCPRSNANINILYPGGDGNDSTDEAGLNVLRRHRLEESLASDYFTVTQPSATTVATIEGLEVDHLSPHNFFFNVIVREGISVAASGDEACFGEDRQMVGNVVALFAEELTKILNSV